MDYHVSVMLNESVQGLNIKEGGIYVDATFGGGGHSKAILNHLGDGRLFSLDQDPDAEKNIDTIEDERFSFIPGNFRNLSRYLKLYGISEIDGLMADLGVSSHQIDKPDRGFSTRFEGDLDMRMDAGAGKTAEDILNGYKQGQLQKILSEFGEIRNAKRLAEKIVRERIEKPFTSTSDFIGRLRMMAPANRENKYFAQIFQALRIEVNDELNALKALLDQSAELIKKNGRLVVMSYHSLEDRLVKNFMNKGNLEGKDIKDLYGNIIRPFRPLNRKPMTASEEELKNNPRSRSAKLRIAEKI